MAELAVDTIVMKCDFLTYVTCESIVEKSLTNANLGQQARKAKACGQSRQQRAVYNGQRDLEGLEFCFSGGG